MKQATATPGLILAAPCSGSGKTTVALGLMRALTRLGRTVQPFKCGPDYIDTAFHGIACRRMPFNLDTWAMRPALIEALITQHGADADIALTEGLMGLFDGVAQAGQSGRGSTADLAALTGWPVVLVLDVSGQGETAAAVALGFKSYRPDVAVKGVILNRVGSPRHAAQIAPAMEKLGLAVLGVIPRRPDVLFEERHLGLVQAVETGDIEPRLEALADVMAETVKLDEVMALAVPTRFGDASASREAGFVPPGQRIALAQDRAFSFTYPHMLDGWRKAGAEILPFSPLADEAPDAAADAVWLPGGYPELHGATLAAAQNFRSGLAALAARSVPIHGECGGYMVLGAGIEDAQGKRHAMTGLLGLETSFAKRRLHLGYRRGRLLASSGLGEAGAQVFGHEFHYASVLAAPDEALVEAQDSNHAPVADRGSRRGSVTGAFFHLIDRAA
jgi:cobyrinic acid a,c-diamide synthase